MEAIIFLSIIIALFSIFISYLVIRRVKKQIAEITDALADVKNGNGNRRILSATNELVAPLAVMMHYHPELVNLEEAGNGEYKTFAVQSTEADTFLEATTLTRVFPVRFFANCVYIIV